jgi:hypothetical protein
LGERVVIEEADGETLIRIRATSYRRMVDSLKYGLLTSVGVLGLSAIRPDWWEDPQSTLTTIAAVGLAVAILAYVRAGERVYVGEGVIRILQPLDSFEVVRTDQQVPHYSPVPSRIWGAQRWGAERGSGVLMFGSYKHGVRFGVDLSEADAMRVQAAFGPSPAGDESVDALGQWRRRAIRILSHLAPPIIALLVALIAFSVDMSRLAALTFMYVAVFAAGGAIDWVERRFPQRVEPQ